MFETLFEFFRPLAVCLLPGVGQRPKHRLKKTSLIVASAVFPTARRRGPKRPDTTAVLSARRAAERKAASSANLHRKEETQNNPKDLPLGLVLPGFPPAESFAAVGRGRGPFPNRPKKIPLARRPLGFAHVTAAGETALAAAHQ